MIWCMHKIKNYPAIKIGAIRNLNRILCADQPHEVLAKSGVKQPSLSTVLTGLRYAGC